MIAMIKPASILLILSGDIFSRSAEERYPSRAEISSCVSISDKDPREMYRNCRNSFD